MSEAEASCRLDGDTVPVWPHETPVDCLNCGRCEGCIQQSIAFVEEMNDAEDDCPYCEGDGCHECDGAGEYE